MNTKTPITEAEIASLVDRFQFEPRMVPLTNSPTHITNIRYHTIQGAHMVGLLIGDEQQAAHSTPVGDQ